MAFTEKQRRFCEEYLKNPNATEAAKSAGYSEKTAYSQGQRLLKNVEVAKALQISRKKAEKRTEVTIDWVVTRLKENVERSMQAEPVYDAEGEPTGEYRYNGNVANKALELLGKYLGMFLDNRPPGDDEPSEPPTIIIEGDDDDG